MEELIAALVGSQAFREAFAVFVVPVVEDVAVKLMSEFFHRRATDPAFLARSDQAFGALNQAKTDQEVKDALAAIRALRAGPAAPASVQHGT